MKWIQSKNGFSLAELICVMAVISCLAAVSIPVYTGWIDRAKEKRLAMEIYSLRDSVQMYVLYSYAQDDWDSMQFLERISDAPVNSAKNPLHEYLTTVPSEAWMIEAVTLTQLEVEELAVVSENYRVILSRDGIRTEPVRKK